MYRNSITRLAIKGQLVLGEHGVIDRGTNVAVMSTGVLTLGNYFEIGHQSFIYVEKEVEIMEHVSFSWNCQVYDTNFHYMVDRNGVVQNRAKRVSIGAYSWIGNHSTIARGAQIGIRSIVASHSLVNKDFSSIEGGLFAGIPAKFIHGDKTKIHKEEWMFVNWFENNNMYDQCTYKIVEKYTK